MENAETLKTDKLKSEPSASIEIFTSWDRFGFVASSHEAPGYESRHCAGPREPAEHLAAHHFGAGCFRLEFVRKGMYRAVAKVAPAQDSQNVFPDGRWSTKEAA